MKITDIKQQVKRKDRYSIFVDGKYSFALSESGLLVAKISIGQEFNGGELESLKQNASEDKGVYRVLDLISRRPRSEWEIKDYLKRKKYSDEEIVKIFEHLSSKGYINDKDFAKRWVESRRLLKQTSKRKLSLELRQKRISDEIINEALAEDETDEQEVLKELITKKRTQTRYQDDQKLIAYLARQGFRYEDIKDALKSF